METMDIEIFLQIARHRNLSRAAAMTHMAQSTVSKRLQMLEETVGYPLLVRGKGLKTVELTPQGEAFLSIAERWQDLLREAQDITLSQPRQHIAIGTVSSAYMTFIAELGRRFWKRKPRLSYRTVTFHSEQMYEEIEKRTIDVAFPLVELASPNVVVRPYFSVPLIGIRLKQGGPRKVEVHSLLAENCMFVPWGASFLTWYDHWFRSGKTPWASVDNPIMLFSALEHPEQWAIVPQSIAQSMLATNRFEIFQIDPAPPERIFYLITHKSPAKLDAAGAQGVQRGTQ